MQSMLSSDANTSQVKIVQKVSGEVYFFDPKTNANSWLPPNWSQEKIRDFLIRVTKLHNCVRFTMPGN
jgi:hypothetical protein